MRALIVYESMFGNTALIAEAIAGGLDRFMATEAVEVGDAPAELPTDLDLLVVGGPTHAFGLSRPSTRAQARNQADGPLVSTRIGLREWLELFRPTTPTAEAACFDTRIASPRLPGTAGSAAARRLRRSGFSLVAEPEHFYVDGATGPLLAGEYQRAHEWGERVGARLAGTYTLVV